MMGDPGRVYVSTPSTRNVDARDASRRRRQSIARARRRARAREVARARERARAFVRVDAWTRASERCVMRATSAARPIAVGRSTTVRDDERVERADGRTTGERDRARDDGRDDVSFGARSLESASSVRTASPPKRGEGRRHANLYVKNIAACIDELTLRRLFEVCGEVVSCCVIRDVSTNKSREFGFVKFASTSLAEDAIERFNGKECAGKVLEVKFANTDGESDCSSAHAHLPPSDNIYVKGLPPSWTQEDLKAYFCQFGHIVESRLLHANKSTSSGALIRFLRESEATAAVQASNGAVLSAFGTPIVVRYAEAQGKMARRGPTAPIPTRAAPDDSAYNGNHLADIFGTVMNFSPPNAGLSELFEVLSGSDEDAAAIAALGSSPTFGSTFNSPTLASQGAIMCVTNLPSMVDELYLYKTFAPFGAIVSAQVIHNVFNGLSTAVVSFRNFAEATNARKLLQKSGCSLHMTVQPQTL